LGVEGGAVHWTVKYSRRAQFVNPQAFSEGLGAQVAKVHIGLEAGSALGSNA